MTNPRDLLQRARTIAVVGCSATPGKEAHDVPRRMLEMGYDVIPVNPRAEEIFGRRCYPALKDVPVPIDVVDVFRPSDEAPGVARQAVEAGAKAVWLQLGIGSDEARRIAEGAGLEYVEDTCIWTVARGLPRRQPADRAD